MNDAETTLASRMVGIDIQRNSLSGIFRTGQATTGESVASFSIVSRGSGLAAVDANGMVSRRSPGGHERLDFAKCWSRSQRQRVAGPAWSG
ncbi:MAG: hypothetical protein ACLSHC_16305 [Bilophila wadsworthia]